MLLYTLLLDEMPHIRITEEEFKVANECRGSQHTGGKFFFLSPCRDFILREKWLNIDAYTVNKKIKLLV